MSDRDRPFRPERYPLQPARDGRPLTLAPFTPEAADILGPAVATVGPWAHYRLDGQRIAATFKSSSESTARYQLACGGEPAGAVVIVRHWLAGPYLQMLAVLPPFQKLGIGAAILGWYETEARGHFRNLWLCVSGFNANAQRFYLAHGYEQVATIPELMQAGDDELLMRKRLA